MNDPGPRHAMLPGFPLTASRLQRMETSGNFECVPRKSSKFPRVSDQSTLVLLADGPVRNARLNFYSLTHAVHDWNLTSAQRLQRPRAAKRTFDQREILAGARWSAAEMLSTAASAYAIAKSGVNDDDVGSRVLSMSRAGRGVRRGVIDPTVPPEFHNGECCCQRPKTTRFVVHLVRV